jgi:hypothetical protein
MENAKPKFNSYRRKNYRTFYKQTRWFYQLMIVLKHQKYEYVTELLNLEYAYQIIQNRSKLCYIVKTIFLFRIFN